MKIIEKYLSIFNYNKKDIATKMCKLIFYDTIKELLIINLSTWKKKLQLYYVRFSFNTKKVSSNNRNTYLHRQNIICNN